MRLVSWPDGGAVICMTELEFMACQLDPTSAPHGVILIDERDTFFYHCPPSNAILAAISPEAVRVCLQFKTGSDGPPATQTQLPFTEELQEDITELVVRKSKDSTDVFRLEQRVCNSVDRIIATHYKHRPLEELLYFSTLVHWNKEKCDEHVSVDVISALESAPMQVLIGGRMTSHPNPKDPSSRIYRRQDPGVYVTRGRVSFHDPRSRVDKAARARSRESAGETARHWFSKMLPSLLLRLIDAADPAVGHIAAACRRAFVPSGPLDMLAPCVAFSVGGTNPRTRLRNNARMQISRIVTSAARQAGRSSFESILPFGWRASLTRAHGRVSTEAFVKVLERDWRAAKLPAPNQCGAIQRGATELHCPYKEADNPIQVCCHEMRKAMPADASSLTPTNIMLLPPQSKDCEN